MPRNKKHNPTKRREKEIEFLGCSTFSEFIFYSIEKMLLHPSQQENTMQQTNKKTRPN